MNTAQSLAELKELGFVVFYFSLNEDCWLGKHLDSQDHIHLYKWDKIPFVPVDLNGFQVRCVTVDDLHKYNVVATTFKVRERTHPFKVRERTQ